MRPRSLHGGLLAMLLLGTMSLPSSQASHEQPSSDSQAVIPLFREELDVQTRTIETGKVRVTKEVRMGVENIQVPTVEKHVAIERIPVNRFVDKPLAVRQEGDVWVIPILEEVPVIEKRLRFKEEVRIRLQETTRERPEKVILRSEHPVIEQLPLEGSGERHQ